MKYYNMNRSSIPKLTLYTAACCLMMTGLSYSQDGPLPGISDSLTGETEATKTHPQTEPSSRFVFFPSQINFVPLKANLYEPRLGVFLLDDVRRMRVDIGNSVDILAWESDEVRVSAGIDFMAYGYITGATGLRLQVDALDGFFGGNIKFIKEYDPNQLRVRLRILHHSAHFVDGHFDSETNSWINGDSPIAYTRDFGELILSHYLVDPSYTIQYYGGFSYATLVRPSNVRRFEPLAGVEIASDRLIGPLFNESFNTFLAYHIFMAGTPVYTSTHQLQIGAKLGQWQGRGITLYISYYSGRHMFKEYLEITLSTFGAGFTVDFN